MGADEKSPTPAPANASVPAPSPQAAGAMLAQAREKAGFSIDYVALQLKLAPRQVRALESGDYAALPGRAFVRGFVRNYARLLDIDAQDVLGALPAGDDQPGLSHPQLASTHRVMGEIPAERARRRSFAGWAIMLALVAIIAVAVLYEKLRPSFPVTAPAADKPAVSAPRSEPPATAPTEPSSPSTPEGRSLPNPVAPPAPSPSSGAAVGDTHDASATPAGFDAVTQVGAPITLAMRTESDTKATVAAVPPASPATVPAGFTTSAAATKASTLQIIFRGTSWLDVKDGTGASILTMTGNEGATRTLDASPPLDLVVGNADHVDIIFRGARVDLAAHAKQNVARLQLR
jgi:cytoskeleton protein RodZ